MADDRGVPDVGLRHGSVRWNIPAAVAEEERSVSFFQLKTIWWNRVKTTRLTIRWHEGTLGGRGRHASHKSALALLIPRKRSSD